MKYLISYKESINNSLSLDEFISELDKELSKIGFSIRYMPAQYSSEYSYIEIGEIDFSGSTYIDFDADSFSIEALKEECNKNLDDDKSTWDCSDEIKDNYDLLCMTILTFLDERNYTITK